MAVLAIDIGNTRIKLAIFIDNGEIGYRMHMPTSEVAYKAGTIAKTAKDCGTEGIVIGSVVPEATQVLLEALGEYSPLVVVGATPCEISVVYNPIESLGADRLAAAVGAYHEYGQVLKRTVMIVDAGTAITADLVGSGGTFIGGAIFPGEELALEALHKGARQLPKINYKFTNAVSGSNTVESMLVGARASVIGGIKHLFKAYGEIRGESPFLLLTGSSAAWIAPELGIPHMIDPDIVLIGLCAIWSYNRR